MEFAERQTPCRIFYMCEEIFLKDAGYSLNCRYRIVHRDLDGTGESNVR